MTNANDLDKLFNPDWNATIGGDSPKPATDSASVEPADFNLSQTGKNELIHWNGAPERIEGVTESVNAALQKALASPGASVKKVANSKSGSVRRNRWIGIGILAITLFGLLFYMAMAQNPALAQMEYSDTDGYICIDEYKGHQTSIRIPEKIDGLPVTTIGEHAFWGCSGLTSVTIPESVTTIGEHAFHGCSGLTEFLVSDANPKFQVQEGVLFSKDGKRLVAHPAGSSRKTYTIPKGVTTIGRFAFSGCSGLTSVTIPSGVTTIGESAFSGCSGLTSVTIPSGVTTIEDRVFFRCIGLTSVTIPDGVTTIGYQAFSGCSGLTNVTIPESVTTIGEYAFFGCRGLTTVTIPESVTTIGEGAFSGCSGLTTVTIPKSVTTIGEEAFCRCSGLTEFSISDANSNYQVLDGVLFSKDGKTLAAYPADSSRKTYTIPESVTEIAEGAFSDCSGLTTVKIPESVTEIGESAFSGCSDLTSVTIPNSVTEIGWYAFSDCSGLTTVTIPEKVTEIGSWAFSRCRGLTTVKIPERVKKIESSAFYGCSGLTEFSISDTNPNYQVQEGVLFSKDGKTLVAYPAGSSRKTYAIPKSVTTIGEYAFSGCSGLTTVKIPENVTEIGESAFAGCSGLTIYAPKGSEAERYAEEENIPFMEIP